MSHHHHEEYCNTGLSYGGGYGMGGYGSGASCGGGGIRWIYALLVLIVIVLQFGRTNRNRVVTSGPCGEDGIVATTGVDGLFDGQLIDNSVLFIIVVFLLILCAGCGTGSSGNYGGAGFGGYGY